MISSCCNQKKPLDLYLSAIIILTAIFIAAFSVLNIAKFRIFSVTSFGWVLPFMYKKLAALHNPFSLFVLPEYNLVLFFAPINYLVAFIYGIFAVPEILLVLQVLIMASGAIPLYLIALGRLRCEYLAFAFSFAYLLHPVISTGALLGYIPLSMGLPFLLWAFYYLEKARMRKFVFFIMLANLTKIDVVLMNAILALVLSFSKEKKEYGRAIFKICIIWLVIAALFGFFYLKFINKLFPIGLLHFDKYGDRMGDVFRYVMDNSGLILNNLFNQRNMLLSMLVFLPNSFALFAPYFLLPIFPEIIYILIRNQHSSGHFPALAFVFFASIYGIDNFFRFFFMVFKREKFKIYSLRLMSFLIVGFALCRYYYIPQKSDFGERLGPLPFTAQFDPNFYKFFQHAAIGEEIIKVIPAGSSCLTLQSIGFHLDKCESVGVFNRYFIASRIVWDYILVDLLKEDFYQISKEDYFLKLKSFILDEDYGVMRFEDGWLLLKKGYKGQDKLSVCGIIDNLLHEKE